MTTILVFLGIIFFPVLTLGCILVHYGHPFLGIVAIIVSFLNFTYDDKQDEKKD